MCGRRQDHLFSGELVGQGQVQRVEDCHGVPVQEAVARVQGVHLFEAECRGLCAEGFVGVAHERHPGQSGHVHRPRLLPAGDPVPVHHPLPGRQARLPLAVQGHHHLHTALHHRRQDRHDPGQAKRQAAALVQGHGEQGRRSQGPICVAHDRHPGQAGHVHHPRLQSAEDPAHVHHPLPGGQAHLSLLVQGYHHLHAPLHSRRQDRHDP